MERYQELIVLVFFVLYSAPMGYLIWKSERLNEKELVEISPEYKGLNADYGIQQTIQIVLGIITVLCSIPIIANPQIQLPEDRNPIVIAAFLILGLVGLTLPDFLFAIKKGVFPVTKKLHIKRRYAYDEKDRIRHIAWWQARIAIGLGVVSLLVLIAVGMRSFVR